MIKIKIYIILFFFKLASAEEIDINIIVENCKACHNLNNNMNNKIPSLSNLEKEEFISLMKNYKLIGTGLVLILLTACAENLITMG